MIYFLLFIPISNSCYFKKPLKWFPNFFSQSCLMLAQFHPKFIITHTTVAVHYDWIILRVFVCGCVCALIVPLGDFCVCVLQHRMEFQIIPSNASFGQQHTTQSFWHFLGVPGRLCGPIEKHLSYAAARRARDMISSFHSQATHAFCSASEAGRASLRRRPSGCSWKYTS